MQVRGEPDHDPAHRQHAREIATEFARYCEQTGSRRIMLIVHGGLVSMEEAVANAQEVLLKMEEAPPAEPAYPIFVNWETGIGKSYLDHLFYVRDGVRNKFWASLTFPFVLVADLGRAVTRSPGTLLQQAFVT